MERFNDSTWWAIRGSRTQPAHRAANGHRRRLYAAALEQFEQLMLASAAVGPSARPLPLFYAMSQATRAIVAARADTIHITSHGFAEYRDGAPSPDPLRRSIQRRGKDGSFGALSRAIGSPDVVGRVQVGAAWAALGTVHRLPTPSWEQDWRSSLDVVPRSGTPRSTAGHYPIELWSISGNPLLSPGETLTLDRYPSIPYGTEASFSGDSPGRWISSIKLPEGHTVDDVARPRGGDGRKHVVPTLPGQKAPLADIAHWWIVLFGLSIFARYHPELWVKALDTDDAETAVPLQAIMTQALDQIPGLVLTELTGPPMPSVRKAPHSSDGTPMVDGQD